MGKNNHLYNTRWRNARKTWLARHPLCVLCKQSGKVTAATVVDHIKPHNGDTSLFWDTNNWQSLCQWHHNAHKQSIEKGGHGRSEVGRDGIPTDPAHHWNR